MTDGGRCKPSILPKDVRPKIVEDPRGDIKIFAFEIS